MKFFFADNVDTVDPNFDFYNHKSSCNRNRQSEDVFAHELLNDPPYDGMLVSYSSVGSFKKSGRYTQGQRHRLYRESAREFLRFPYRGYSGDPLNFPIMGDCGSFAYINDPKPPYSIKEVAEFYESCRFTHGVSPDHIILDNNKSWDSSMKRPKYISARAEYTLNSAKSFLKLCQNHNFNFIPIGVVQAWSPASYAKFSKMLVQDGFNYIGLGGLAGRPYKEILSIMTEVRSTIPIRVSIHIFGFNKFNFLEKFCGLDISSFDSTSPLIRAFKDDSDNYFSANGKNYSAIRIPQLNEVKLKRKIESGTIDQTLVSGLFLKCFKSIRAFDKKNLALKVVLDSISQYNKLLWPDLNKLKLYRRTLTDRPWENCKCEICKDIGIDVVIFGGINRNKRRGFHNLFVFFNRLKGVRSMNTIKVPCIRVKQNKNKYLFSFITNGKNIPKFASISRIRRSDEGVIYGYQRPELFNHIDEIRNYLEKSDAILPNSIVVAFNKQLKFYPKDKVDENSSFGYLEIPIGKEDKVGWIVDGQQRTAALRTLKRDDFPVSIIAFQSERVEEEREQFVFINNTRKLPNSLVYELLPSLNNSIPPRLKKRQRAYRILENLNLDPSSPFYSRVKTVTSSHIDLANIKDVSILKMIENSFENGILNKFHGSLEKPTKILKNYWSAVKTYYIDAWELPPKKSRLTHGAGIVSMGYIMDSMSYRLSDRWEVVPQNVFLDELKLLGNKIPWTNGRWEFGKDIILPWNGVQNTGKHVELVTNYLIRKYKSNVTNSSS